MGGEGGRGGEGKGETKCREWRKGRGGGGEEKKRKKMLS